MPPYQGHVGVHGVELKVDLLVDSLFGIGVVVLAYLTHLVAFFLEVFQSVRGRKGKVVSFTNSGS